MCNFKKSNLLPCVCQPVLLLLYIMLAYLMLPTALFNAVCLHNTSLLFSYFALGFCTGIY